MGVLAVGRLLKLSLAPGPVLEMIGRGWWWWEVMSDGQ